MSTVAEEPVKSLGRWYETPLSDKGRGMQVQKQVQEGIKAIDKSGLPGKYKAWCLQFGLLPRILWPLTIYNVGVARVEKMEQMISAKFRKWLGFPRMLSTNALYGKSNILLLPCSSLVEEFKCRKVGMAMMMRESPDSVIAGMEPRVESMRKWNPVHEMEKGIEAAKFKEIRGAVANGREGIGCRKVQWWSKQNAKGRREMVVKEVRESEELRRSQSAVQQVQQGAWTTWDKVEGKKISWRKIWALNQGRLKFMVSSVYDVLPTPVNLMKWGKSESATCNFCEKASASLEHFLSGCHASLQMYTKRHNEVLRLMHEMVCEQIRGKKQKGALLG